MEKIVKNSIITVLIIIAVFIVGLMDDKKITSLTVENTVAKNANKVITTTANKKFVSIRIDKNKISFNSKEPNVVSNISEIDLKNLLKSKKESWKIFNEQNDEYSKSYSKKVLKLSNESYKSLTINDGFKYYTIDNNNGIYEINYPNVATDDNYFHTFEDALNSCDNDCTITLYNSLDLSNIELDKNITINGNYQTIYVKDYLFNLKSSKIEVTLNNVKINTQYLLKVGKKNKNKLILNNSKIIYSELANNKIKVENNKSSLSKYL